jgi:hypothetical protein
VGIYEFLSSIVDLACEFLRVNRGIDDDLFAERIVIAERLPSAIVPARENGA